MRTLALSIFILFALVTGAQAEEALSITPEQTWQLVQDNGDNILFVDVRDPVEIMFVGFTDAVDINIPFKLVDRTRFNDAKGKFAMDTNPDFASDVEKALKAKGLDKNALVITMCRSGSTRGKPSAEYLLKHGFSQVKYIDHGFQGSSAKDGKMKGLRVVNGWQNSGLPWSMDINPEKIYRP